jgi:hypothetical protein
MIDIGVANPKAQGQAMINTVTAATMAYDSAGDGPRISQTMKLIAATSMTVGTNQADTRSASF